MKPIWQLRATMSLPPSNSETASFGLLDERIRQWIWSQGWKSLRSVQEQAIPLLLDGTSDVILAAATSAGKTEAAFFPLLTRLLQNESRSGFILSISPLKALINDQTQRLTSICDPLDVPVLGWHGDISASKKQRFLKEMKGVMIITPESLEALFVNRGTLMPAFASAVQCVVIDELHSFIGSERGKQVQSLLHRLELAGQKRIPRAGLSATLGDKSLAAEFLRIDKGKVVKTIDAASEGYELKLLVKGYVDEWSVPDKRQIEDSNIRDDIAEDEIEETTSEGASKFAIADYLYQHLHGTNNLIFPNSRSSVEFYADQLRRRCEREGVPNEFWPHHGSLSRELREESEAALKSGQAAATAVCTTTLELGIDIGNIRSVAQIGSPPSVASLRQRLGRSGRRANEPAILRCFAIERKLSPKSTFSDRIREGLVQTISIVRLLLAQWLEPPRTEALHASTLVQQLLSVIAEKGGATAVDLWQTLVRSSVFGQIQAADFSDLLRELGARDLISQESSGVLLLGVLGEKLINQYEFYSAFNSGEEFRVVAEGHNLGSLPILRPLVPAQRIIFAGRRWKVQSIDPDSKVIYVVNDRGGKPPAFDGIAGAVHGHIREEMKRVLSETSTIPFLDTKAGSLLEEARDWYKASSLAQKPYFSDGASTLLLGWRGDLTHDALSLLLTARGLQATNEGVAIRVSSTDNQRLIAVLRAIGEGSPPSIDDLKIEPDHAIREKWDWALPEGLRLRSFVSAELDLKGAHELAARLSAINVNSA
ncbi:DEAD/DEAH box helicase [Terracidiphilus gabretensis]|uniref:DEAD/DEAH box helicase n=1 Tax=Terracidiphilus gabretensis TaxID=1577687 RepID=UPI0018D26E85|nr:DEAD/DEAH box helicase [Terracidiphilus gabretensis]